MDYVALDVKTSSEKYRALGADDTTPLLKSIWIMKNSKVDYEFRTTVVPEIVTAEDIREIGEMCDGARRFALQQFVAENAYEERFRRLRPYPSEVLRSFASILKLHVGEVLLRV